MEEKVLAESKRTKGLILSLLVPSIGLLVFMYKLLIRAGRSWRIYNIWVTSLDNPVRHSFLEMVRGALETQNDLLFAAYVAPAFLILGLLIYICWFKSEVTITDKRIYGRTAFGKKIDFPIDLIFSVKKSAFSGIDIVMQNGRVRWKFLSNQKGIYSVVNDFCKKKETTENVMKVPTNKKRSFESMKDKLLISVPVHNVLSGLFVMVIGAIIIACCGVAEDEFGDAGFFLFIIVGAMIALCGLVLMFSNMKCGLSVTDRFVRLTNAFGKRVEIPIDSISTISLTSAFLYGISISSDSGRIIFLFVKERAKIFDVVHNLLIERQEQNNASYVHDTMSNADELKKFKELLDDGIITQEEFDAKKKELLRL